VPGKRRKKRQFCFACTYIEREWIDREIYKIDDPKSKRDSFSLARRVFKR
jgi:hypothetical protein